MEFQYYNLSHKPTSSKLKTSSSSHLKIEKVKKIIIKNPLAQTTQLPVSNFQRKPIKLKRVTSQQYLPPPMFKAVQKSRQRCLKLRDSKQMLRSTQHRKAVKNQNEYEYLHNTQQKATKVRNARSAYDKIQSTLETLKSNRKSNLKLVKAKSTKNISKLNQTIQDYQNKKKLDQILNRFMTVVKQYQIKIQNQQQLKRMLEVQNQQLREHCKSIKNLKKSYTQIQNNLITDPNIHTNGSQTIRGSMTKKKFGRTQTINSNKRKQKH